MNCIRQSLKISNNKTKILLFNTIFQRLETMKREREQNDCFKAK